MLFHRRRQSAGRDTTTRSWQKDALQGGCCTWLKRPVLTKTVAEGGAGKALGRMFMGEKLFMNTYTAQGPAEIAFSSSFPGG